MNVLEKYASSCGVKISKPNVGASYFPLKWDKYIVIDNRNKNGGNVYDSYSDVMSYIHPILEKEGIGIVSFAKEEKYIIEKTAPYISITKKQEAYFIQNSLLTVSSDNLSAYLADGQGVPSIGLYSIYPSESNRPIWTDKHTVIESERCGNLPSYGVAEDPKAINFIEPEKVAQAILDKVGIDFKILHDTVFIGDLYSIKVVEAIPDFATEPNFMKNKALNIRMDYHFDEQNLCHWLTGRYINILTDKKINLDLLRHYKKNIAQLTVTINDNFDEAYLKEVRKIGIKLEIFCENPEKIEKYRFKYFDFKINESEYKTKEDIDFEINDKSVFVSSKILLSEGQKFSCYEAKKQKKPLTGGVEPVYNTEDFWKELDYYRIIQHGY